MLKYLWVNMMSAIDSISSEENTDKASEANCWQLVTLGEEYLEGVLCYSCSSSVSLKLFQNPHNGMIPGHRDFSPSRCQCSPFSISYTLKIILSLILSIPQQTLIEQVPCAWQCARPLNCTLFSALSLSHSPDTLHKRSLQMAACRASLYCCIPSTASTF